MGTIQVDLDGIWTYRRYLGQQTDNCTEDAVYREGLLFFLGLFKRYSIKATFFIVGRDALKYEHRTLIKKIISDGHEIANHTMNHPQGFSRLLPEEMEQEIGLCEDILKQISGRPVSGFRAPTFSVNRRVLSMLSERKYVYDASILPSMILPFILKVSHSILRKRIINVQTGNYKNAFSPLSIYRPDQRLIWKRGVNSIFEVPISVIPHGRLPMHSTYVFILGRKYFELGLSQLKKDNLSLSYLFHGIDLVDLKKQKLALPFFGDLKKREKMCEYIIQKLQSSFELLTTEQLVERQR